MQIKYFILVILMLFSFSASAATVTFSVTNSLGQPDSTPIKVYTLVGAAQADGSWQSVGIPFNILLTNGIGSKVLAAGNYKLTNSTLVSPSYVGPANFGTSQGIIIAVPSANGTYPFGLLTIPGYNVYNYNGSAAFSNTNSLGVGAGTNVVIQTNSGSVTVQVPNQAFLTNGLPSRLDVTNIANAAYSNNLAGYVQSTVFNSATNSLAGVSLAQLQATNTALKSSSQIGSTTLTNLAATGAQTNQLVGSGGVTLSTNAGVITIFSVGTNGLISTNDLKLYQIASANLTNWSSIATNQFAPTNFASANANGILKSNDWAAFNNSASGSFNIGGVITNTATNTIFSYAGTNSIINIINSLTNGLASSSNVVVYPVGNIFIGGSNNFYTSAFGSAAYNVFIGGRNNSLTPLAPNSIFGCIQMGTFNSGLSGTLTYAAVIGGLNGGITTGGDFSVQLGGSNNQVGAQSSVELGGANNRVSTGANFSIAGGCGANAAFAGDFVWADSSSNAFNSFASTGTNQFLVRALGGFGLNTNNPGTNALAIHGSETVNGDFTTLNNLNLSGLHPYQLTTNIVATLSAGVSIVIGTYTNIIGTLYTNTLGNGVDLKFSTPTWFFRTNNGAGGQVNLYSASSVGAGSVWADVVGVSTPPVTSYGYTNNFIGQVVANFPIAASGGGSAGPVPTNTVAAGSGITVATNTTGGNSVYTISAQQQTNGFFAYTNFVQNITNGLATTNYVNTATNGFATTNFAYANFYPSNNPSQFTTIALATNGIANTNFVITSELAVSNGATRVYFFQSNPSNSITTTSSSIGFGTNGMVWINRNGNSNNWLVLITTNK